MRHCVLGLVLAPAFIALAPTWSVPAAAQRAPTATTWAPPRTAWGHPDLEGIWSTQTVTPFERPGELAGKAVLTAEEAAELEGRAAANRVDRPPRPGDPGTYNQFWSERGASVVYDRRTSLVVDPADGRIPWKPEVALENARAEAAYGAGTYDSWFDLDTGERCLTDGPTVTPSQSYNMNFQIVQTPDHVVILHEMYHQRTIVPLDGRPRVSPSIGLWLGDPRGRWEGDTLVVETRNFADKRHYRWSRLWRSARPTLRLVERFTLVDANTIDYRFTIEDATMFMRPWTAAVPMVRTEGPLFEYACHEGNYSVTNVLSGARAMEKSSSGEKP